MQSPPKTPSKGGRGADTGGTLMAGMAVKKHEKKADADEKKRIETMAKDSEYMGKLKSEMEMASHSSVCTCLGVCTCGGLRYVDLGVQRKGHLSVQLAKGEIQLPPMQMPLDIQMPIPPEVQDIEVVTREFPHGMGMFEVRHNVQLSKSLLSGRLEWTTSTGGRSKFEGTFLNHPQNEEPCMHGKGHRRNVDGSTYIGDWQHGHPHGHGEWKAPPPSFESYLGEWKFGKRHGFGIQKYPNGDMYEGDWKNGKFHDRGTFSYANGDQFSGIFEDGIKCHGSFNFKDGRVSRRVYQGGRLVSSQDFDPRRRSYLPTITRTEVHDPKRNAYGGRHHAISMEDALDQGDAHNAGFARPSLATRTSYVRTHQHEE